MKGRTVTRGRADRFCSTDSVCAGNYAAVSPVADEPESVA